jgi:hypothetical protein
MLAADIDIDIKIVSDTLGHSDTRITAEGAARKAEKARKKVRRAKKAQAESKKQARRKKPKE